LLELEFILSQDVVDMVIAASPDFTQKSLQIVANLCERWLVEFKIAPSCFQIFVSGLSLESISGVPVLGVSRLPLDIPLNAVLKRLADLAGGAIGMLISLPIIAVFGALLYLEDPGPVFFAQERLGRGGRKFRMYKLRSMRMGADASDNLHQSTQRQDPRILTIGAFIRRWNIDETPQFWNVLKGEMSLVGPRPERTFHSEALSTEIPHYNARYNSLPGITGWAQVNGLRGDTDLVERIKCDLYYIENWNLLLDLQIIVLTLSRNRNAY
jgi:exopolysaccharide biosynthesis polyprenyl glycosylphosphotransferase